MNKIFLGIRARAVKTVFASLTFLTLLAVVHPSPAQARTSGGATIYNTVKVTYQSGTTVLFETANYSITVNTVAAAPSVTYPANQIVVAGDTVTYNYMLKSNSNGLDTYTTSALSNAQDANIGAATGTSVTASVSLWGGISLGSGVGFITVPFGSTTGLIANTSTVQIGTSTYLVTAIAAGSAASTDGSGDLVVEVPATLTLAPISGPAITAASAPAGTQVGEYLAAALSAVLTAAAPNTAGFDGEYLTHFTISTGALPVALTLTTTDMTTTVSAPKVTVTKTANSTTASPDATITYTITVKNEHTTAQVDNVIVIDAVPRYTTYVADSTTLNGLAVFGDGGTSPLVAPGLIVDNNAGRTAGAVATGILPAGQTAVIAFQVKVD